MTATGRQRRCRPAAGGAARSVRRRPPRCAGEGRSGADEEERRDPTRPAVPRGLRGGHRRLRTDRLSAVQKGQAPGSTAPPGNSTPGGVAASGDPLSFQSQNLEALAAKRAGIEAAFGLRASKSNNWTDDQWLGFDRAEQEKIYVAKMTDLKQFPTVEKRNHSVIRGRVAMPGR